MRRPLWWAWFLGAVVAVGCTGPLPGPTPVPPPIPTPVPDPVPPPVVVPVENPVPFATSTKIVPGMTRGALLNLIGREGASRKQDDGTEIVRWPATDEAGGPRWLDVQLEADLVLGYGLWPR